ncbi:MAG: hypothetical protein ACE5H9_18570, partial [Anaerolineae bacterium]
FCRIYGLQNLFGLYVWGALNNILARSERIVIASGNEKPFPFSGDFFSSVGGRRSPPQGGGEKILAKYEKLIIMDPLTPV